MTLTLKERELVAVGISVAAGCKPCTDYHFKIARKAKATDAEIRGALTNAISVRRDALRVMENYGLDHLGNTDINRIGDGSYIKTDRLAELVSIGAAFAVNCTNNLEKLLLSAARVGRIAEDEIRAVTKLARFIKDRAASHVEKLVKSPGSLKETRPPKPAAAEGRSTSVSAATAQ